MDEDQALERIDAELDAVLGGLTAPPRFNSMVLSRTRRPARTPEILDGIGLLAVLGATLAGLLYLIPSFEIDYRWIAVTTAVVIIMSFALALRLLREV